MKRRAFLRASGVLAAGGVVAAHGAQAASLSSARLLPPIGGGSGEEDPRPSTAQQPRDSARFFQNDALNFVFLIALGGAYYQVADVGTCLAIADAIPDSDFGSAFRAFSAAGERFAAEADAALAAGRRISAREAYWEAANYLFSATYCADPMGAPEQFAPTWHRQQALWEQGGALLDPPVELVRIPYEGTTLPGYFFRADATDAPRPLLIFNNGSDSALTAAWVLGIAAGLARGYHCLTFYGPGQGLALLDQGLHFRPDWERVITPVVDYALTRPEVDPRRLALLGVSQAGYWVPRAVAFEPRIAAAVADPGVVDVSASWFAYLPPPMRQLLAAGQKEEFDRYMAEGLQDDPVAAGTLRFRMRPYGVRSYYDAYKLVEQYRLGDDVLQRIRCPMLVTDPDGEQFWPGQSQQLYEALPGPKELVRFTAAEGADLHCEPKTPGLRARRIFDWLDSVLA